MLPFIQAEEIKHAIAEYLKSTCNFSEPDVEQAFEDFLLHKHRGMFKGPYLQLRLPFKKMDEADLSAGVLHVRPRFTPYHHQWETFKRLSTREDHAPEPVILTTGTGSGKTESFLFPILDYCYQQKDTKGIKAIILYPMNALATDQARRFAEEIHDWSDENGNFPLRGIRVGLFIGEGKDKKKQRPTRMDKDHVIEDRDTLLQSPPDILLTNFKMLDFALMQARFQGLWKCNIDAPDLLKFLVLDELHTYDGAKGSDVASLIRRLKLKLRLKNITPVGTSATMSGGESGKLQLVRFCSDVFGCNIGLQSIIEENRMDADSFFDEETYSPSIDVAGITQCQFYETDDYVSYINRQLDFWGYGGKSPAETATALKQNEYLYDLLYLVQNNIVEIEKLIAPWIEKTGLPVTGKEQQKALLFSLLSLITYAKEQSGSKLFPFLYLQITYWVRSLSKIVRKLQQTPAFEWEGDLNPNDRIEQLPPYYCRECGGSGWIGWKKENNDFFERDLGRTRNLFVGDGQNKNIYLVPLLGNRQVTDILDDEYRNSTDCNTAYINPYSLEIADKRISEDYFKVLLLRRQNDDHIEKRCPHCNSLNTLALIGTGLPTIESVAAAQILSTPTDQSNNQNRKLLVFTNGVQDAAHQAGFIENRNYRFGLRHAIQTVLKQNEENVRLSDFYKQFEQYWQQASDDQEQNTLMPYYYKFLPPDCESNINLKDYHDKNGKFAPGFMREFSHRISWEIWSEFSYNSILGRTLEKSGASGVSYDLNVFGDVYRQLRTWLNENHLADRVDEKGFMCFLGGLFYRLRTKGAVDHPYLKKFRSEKSTYYYITQSVNKQHFLIKNFGKNTRLPRFVTYEKNRHTGAFDILKKETNRNWYFDYFLKSFPLVSAVETDLVNEFYETLLDYLDANRILDKKVATGVPNYAISPEQICLTSNIKAYSCSQCKHTIHAGADNGTLYEGMACTVHRCPGHYTVADTVPFDYYRLVYNRGRSIRIYAKDHTGLIDRNKREQLEIDFKKRPHFNSTNVLVATSTLEMGIDIGDLNVTFNSSLPPETANYIQRVGRAGRSSGTSLILNLAGSEEHDMYYFHDPANMMNGQVKTPSCYLEAKDILNRHFMAYCFDCWASVSRDNDIPPFVKMLSLKSLPVGDGRFVFNRIAKFIDQNKQNLFNLFVSQYPKEIAESDSLKDIQDQLAGNAFILKLTNIHQNLLDEINFYENKRSEIKRILVKLPQTGQEAIELKKEMRALSQVIYNINKRNTIEYLTNTGILPNYAFPETGVLFKAQVATTRKDEDNRLSYSYEDIDEIVRPASSAISELAPGNYFYTQGYKLECQGLEIKSGDEYELYRFCSNCDHMEPTVNMSGGQELCPKCGNRSWGSVSNIKTLVKLTSVLSNNTREYSRITDTSDERDRKFYHHSIHIQTNSLFSKGAKMLKRVPFGIEFFTKTDYTHVNTGLSDDFFSNGRLTINGEEHPETGFVVCPSCGKTSERVFTQSELTQSSRRKSYHFAYCRDRDKIFSNEEDNKHFKKVYLYRKFTTESLKILLPVQEFRTLEKIAVFKAGLYLGLKDYFKGHPDHIHIRDYMEFNTNTGRKESYLVMYESIPGGTGYLSRLFDKNEFTALLRSAYEHIRLCDCKDEGKDGCYKCIYTYGNQYERETLSRNEAEQLFRNILEKAGEWIETESLSGSAIYANNEESELEDMFVDMLTQKYQDKKLSDWIVSVADGCKRYELTLRTDDANNIKYEIYPQNRGANLQGVKYTTRPDFLVKCVSLTRNGVNASFDEIEYIKAIAVYLDGYQYHATRDCPRTVSDLKIRKGIIESGRYHLWVFTWTDIHDGMKNNSVDLLNSKTDSSIINNLLPKHPVMKKSGWAANDFKVKNSFERFEKLLEAPLRQADMSIWSAISLFACQKSLLENCYSENDIELFSETRMIDVGKSTSRNLSGYVHADLLKFAIELGVAVFIQPQTLAVKNFFIYDSGKTEWEKENWYFFWQVFNLTQFHVSDRSISGFSRGKSTLDNFDEVLHPIVIQLMKAGIEFNDEYDFDFMENDEIKASAELGSQSKQFFIRPFDEQSRTFFIRKGYQEFDIDNFDIRLINK